MINKIRHIILSRLPLIAFLIIYLGFSLLTFRHYGISNDEPVEYLMGKFLYTYIRTNDPTLSQSFKVYSGDNPDIIFYNHIYGAVVHAFNNPESYERYHLLNLLFASTIFIATYEILLKETKNRWMSLLAPVFIVLTPNFFGHIPINPKDIPFANAFLFSLATILCFRHNKFLFIPLAGIAFGITQSLRIIGYSIYPIFIAFIFIEWWISSRKSINLLALSSWIATTIAIFLIGTSIHVLSQPYLQSNFPMHFVELVRRSAAFPWEGTVIFAGKEYLASNLPWTYIPIWWLITTPIFIILLSISSLRIIKKSSAARLLWLALIINLSIITVTNPTIYDGIRHLLYLVLLFPILAGLHFYYLFTQKQPWTPAITKLVVINGLVTAVLAVSFFPFTYSFFNAPALLIKANQSFEADYWGLSYKQLLHNFEATNTPGSPHYQVYFCGDPQQLLKQSTLNYTIVDNIKDAELIICHHRGGHADIFNQDYRVLQTIQRHGVVYSAILKPPSE